MNIQGISLLYNNIIKDTHKEHIGMIVEPLQTILQLSALAFYPIGTKLSITKNNVSLQPPEWYQPAIRSMYSDTKKDLIYLHSAIRRFSLFYSFLKDNETTNELYELLIKYSKLGIQNLILTYSKHNDIYISETLNTYTSFLDNNNLTNSNNDINIVFKQITSLYKHEHYNIILNNFKLLQNDKENYHFYFSSIKKCLSPINNNIPAWIQKNIKC